MGVVLGPSLLVATAMGWEKLTLKSCKFVSHQAYEETLVFPSLELATV